MRGIRALTLSQHGRRYFQSWSSGPSNRRHIVENHDEVAGYYDQVLEAVEDPDHILQGYGGALISAYFTSEVPRR